MIREDGDDPETPSSAGAITSIFLLVPWFRNRRALARGEKTRMLDRKEGWTVLGIGRPHAPGRRVDMLANEDSSMYAGPARRHGSGSSRSWFSVNDTSSHLRHGSQNSSRPSIGRLFSDPLGSFRNVSAGVKRVFSAGSSRAHGREGTDVSLPFDIDDYEDSEGLLLHDKNSQYALDPVANEDLRTSEDLGRLRGGRLGPSEATSYTDPFVDPLGEVIFDSSYADRDRGDDDESRTTSRKAVEGAYDDSSRFSTMSSSSQMPQLHPLVTTASKTSSENPSSSSLLNASSTSHASSSSHPSGPRTPSSLNRPRTTSIIGAVGLSSSPVRRSDSWWQRFKRTSSIRDSLKEQSKYQPAPVVPVDFRDPNPPPGRLGAIKEGSGGSSRTNESPTNATHGSHNHRKVPSGSKSGAGHVYSTSGHEQSTTSLKTNKTADSAALERFARGRYDIAQREATGGSTDSSPGLAERHDPEGTWSSVARSLDSPRAPSPVLMEGQDIADSVPSILNHDDAPRLVQSPTEALAGPLSPTRRAMEEPQERKPVRRTPSSPRKQGAVAARIAEYERRMSVELESASSPPLRAKSPPVLGKRKSENVKYGFVHRPELFVANPDHRRSMDSSSA